MVNSQKNHNLFRKSKPWGYFCDDVEEAINNYEEALKKSNEVIRHEKEAILKQQETIKNLKEELKDMHLQMSNIELPDTSANDEISILTSFKEYNQPEKLEAPKRNVNTKGAIVDVDDDHSLDDGINIIV